VDLDILLPNPTASFIPLSNLSSQQVTDTLFNQIAQYRLIRVLGIGGMGTVYLAEQENPRRLVAIKLIHATTNPERLARFAREAQALGRLRHYGIAQIFEAGNAEIAGQKQPFLVMEYIEGASLLDYARRKKLSVKERFQLLADVCDAVEHAHKRGVIHRDLKPGNILVTEEGDIKIVDFGVARVLEESSPLTTSLTADGLLVGTVNYMSPEQTRSDDSEVGTRSDIYTLGLIGFELLSGRLPYTLVSQDIIDSITIIREQPPLGLGGLVPECRGDGELIIRKALQKEPDQRYSSAEAMAEDIWRYLSSQPIKARSPSLSYQFKIFTRRNRALTMALFGLIFTVLAGSIATTLFAFGERRAHQKAEAEAQANRATLKFIQSIFSTANPAFAQGRTVTVREALEYALPQATQEFTDQPSIKAEVFDIVGTVYYSLGDTRSALRVYQKAYDDLHAILPANDVDLLNIMGGLGAIKVSLGRLSEAETLLHPAYEGLKATLGTQHPKTLRNQYRLAALLFEQERDDQARSLLEDLIPKLERTTANDELNIRARSVLADLNKRGNGAKQTLAEFEQIYLLAKQKLGGTHPKTLFAMNNLAVAEADAGKQDQARKRLADEMDTLQHILGPTHWQTLLAQADLADFELSVGHIDKANALLTSAIAETGTLEEQHPVKLRLKTLYAYILFFKSDYTKAADLMDSVVENLINTRGEMDGKTLETMVDYAVILNQAKRTEEASKWYQRALNLTRQRFGQDHVHTLHAEREYAAWLGDVNRVDESNEQFAKLLPRLRKTLGDTHLETVMALYQYSYTLQQRKEYDKALILTNELIQKVDKVPDGAQPVALIAPMRHGVSLLGVGRYEEAEQAMLESWRRLKEVPSMGEDVKIRVVNNLVNLYQTTHQAKKAAEWQKTLAGLEVELEAKNPLPTSQAMANNQTKKK